jgi:anti-sigma28 factor (negative regulator of flagellin synthesis)
MAYFLLSGDIPFFGDDIEEIYAAIEKGEWDMDEEVW